MAPTDTTSKENVMTERMADRVASRTGTRVHYLDRPVSMNYTYGHWNDSWARTLCGRKVSGLGYTDGSDGSFSVSVTCPTCNRKSTETADLTAANDVIAAAKARIAAGLPL